MQEAKIKLNSLCPSCHSSEQSKDDEQPKDDLTQLAYVNGRDKLPDMKNGVEEDIKSAKLETMKELFPQRSDQDLLEVIMLYSLNLF